MVYTTQLLLQCAEYFVVILAVPSVFAFVRIIGHRRFLYGLDSFCIVFVNAAPQTCQHCGPQRCCLINVRHGEGEAGNISLVLHPEGVFCGAAGGDDAFRGAQTIGLEGFQHHAELIVQSFKYSPHHITAGDDVLQPQEGTHGIRIAEGRAGAGEVRQEKSSLWSPEEPPPQP